MGYLRVIYSENRRPYTSYPGKLCRERNIISIIGNDYWRLLTGGINWFRNEEWERRQRVRGNDKATMRCYCRGQKYQSNV